CLRVDPAIRAAPAAGSHRSRTLAVVTLGALLAVIRPPNTAQLRGLLEFTPELTPLSPMARHRDAAPFLGAPRAAATVRPGKPGAPGPLLDDSAGALDAFYRALRRTGNREPGAVTRIVHYGDSPTTADLITGDVRAL